MRAILIAGALAPLGAAVAHDGALGPFRVAGGAWADAQPLALGGHASGGYLEVRAARLAELSAAQGERGVASPADDEVARALLDLAAFHMARGFVREGRDVVAALSDAALAPALRARRDLLAASLSVLDPLWQGDLPSAVRVLEAASGPTARILHAYGLQRMGASGAAAALLSGDAGRLDALPPPLVSRVLPSLLAAAVAAEDWPLARGLAGRLALVRDPGDGALPYLLGQVALGGGDPLVAFEHFVEAAPARDVWGHRARLEIVRLGLDHEAIGHDEALALLSRADTLWRGGDDGLRTLLEMERVAVEGGNSRAAALALGEVLVRHGDAPEAEAAETRAMSHVHDYYEAGRTGEIDLDAFIEGHRELSAMFRFVPGFEDASAVFADHMLSIGATAAAAEEFRLTREYLEAAAELGLREPEPARLDRLRLREAETHLAGGRIEAAGLLLGAPLRSEDAALETQLHQLRARFAALSGEALPDGSGVLPRSENLLRLLARGHVSAGRWGEARDAYVELWQMLGDDMPSADAVGLLVAAERTGDAHLVDTLAPLLSDRDREMALVLMDGAAPDASGARLGSASARALVQRAADALERVEALADEMVAGPDTADESSRISQD